MLTGDTPLTQASRRTPCLPACSVVIPCYNALRTIAATIDSARRQTVKDIEIIVVDDGSRDAGAETIAAIAKIDPRILVIKQSNAGVSAARNTGIAAASSRIIAFLDSDDLWAATHLEAHLRRLQNDPRLGLSYSPARFIDTIGKVIGRSRPKLEKLTPLDMLLGNPTTTCSTLVVKREVFKDVGLFKTRMRHNEDQEWLFRVALSGWVMSGDPALLVDYRTSPGGLASDLAGMFHGFEIMMQEARKLAPKLVERNARSATANMHRYLARRSIAIGLPRSVARSYMFSGIRTRPIMLLAEPLATLPTLAACFLPPTLTTNMLHYARQHAVNA